MSGANARTRLVYPPARQDVASAPKRAADTRRHAGHAISPTSTQGDTATLAATDPRWVLAMRTQKAMQGAMLEPDRRDALIRLAHTLGLNTFEANLVIAIVQDQARRGQTLHHATDSLRMVPINGGANPKRWQRVAFWVGLTLVLELLIIAFMLN